MTRHIPLVGDAMFSRRRMLESLSCGFGMVALAGLCQQARADDTAEPLAGPLAPKPPHHTPRAKRVIFLSMRGGPSHVDMFDYKPALARDEGQPSAVAKNRKLAPSIFQFEPRGESGLPISSVLPHLGGQADKLCLLNGMTVDIPNHPEAYIKMHTGSFRFVRPSVGAWVLYGLGTENSNVPGFLVLNPDQRIGGAQNYGSSFLPAVYQGTPVGQLGQSIAAAKIGHLKHPWLAREQQRQQIDVVQEMNRELLERRQVSAELEGVIESFELAFRMQSAMPELMNLSDETSATLQMYGVNGKETADFGRQCLLARRCVEAGVRYIELTHANWDQHNGLRANLTKNCTAIDQPIAALLTDLEQRGLLDETLVVWGGEFGRTPHVVRPDGRDHNATGFTMWMAGGGVKGGLRYGATDEHGITAVDGKLDFHDLHATMLHLLGLDHTQLTYRYAGRDFRLTDVYGRVPTEILA